LVVVIHDCAYEKFHSCFGDKEGVGREYSRYKSVRKATNKANPRDAVLQYGRKLGGESSLEVAEVWM
jgi:hypothetical protein